ncbi:MAG: PAS domain S-box protein [Methanoregula sp.]|uniref:PAS domain S-box protein n=1 Tax=Methanoregula sp. TaxID=2052170 RepID=UPI003C77C4EA
MSVNIFALLSIVSGVLILSLGVFVFDQNRKSPQHIIFLFLCGFASWWAFAESMMLGAESFATAGFWMKATALWTFVPPLALNFIVVFTRPDSWKNERWIYPILYAPALIFCWIELTSSLITTAPIQAFGGYVFGYSRQSLLPLVEISWGVIIAILAMLLCVQFYFTTTDHRKKQQAKYIIAGIGITAAFGILTQQMLPGLQFPIPDLTSASFLCFTGCVGYAIWKYRLFILNPATVADNILSTMTDGVVILDPEGNIVATNQALSTMVGTVKEQCVGRPVSDLFYHESDKATIVAMILAQGSLSDYETTFRSEEGRAIPVSFSGSVIRDTDGSVAGFVGVSRDITERKRAEEALGQARKKLNVLNAITFSDIQTTIFSLTGYLELEKSMPAGERQQRFIDREIELVQVIADSLKYAELFQSLGLKSPVWQNVGQSFLLGISHLDISHLSRRLDVEHVEVYADPMLEHVFLALADNIREHAPTATEYSFTYTENLQGLVLVFKDNGPGIPASLKEKIFEREYCRRNEIGLYLSREILSITGISIRETGEEGKGARFEILVPPGAWRKTRQP